MSLADTQKHWLWGCAAATAASRSEVNVAMPHLRGRWSPTKAILRTLGDSFMDVPCSNARTSGGSCGSNDEPAGRRTHEVKRVAGDQRQDFVSVRVQHRQIVRVYHLRRHHAVAILASGRGKCDEIVDLDISQRPEERVTMPRDTNVAGLSRKGGAANMAYSAAKSLVADSLHDDNRHSQALNLHAADQSARSDDRWCGNQGRRRSKLLQRGSLLFLKNPGVQDNKRAIAEKQYCSHEEHALGPLQDPPRRRRFYHDLHRQDAWILRYSGCHIASSTCRTMSVSSTVASPSATAASATATATVTVTLRRSSMCGSNDAPDRRTATRLDNAF